LVANRTWTVSLKAPDTPASATLDRNTSDGTRHTVHGDDVVTVDERAAPRNSPISPK
jgi:hypothetical protein